MSDWLFALQIFSTFSLFGVIWLVQLLVYPHFLEFDRSRFLELHKNHVFRISPIVAPLKLIEIFSALGMLYYPLGQFTSTELWINFGSVVAVWMSTIFIQIPLHRKLERDLDAGLRRQYIGRLILTNWIRTILWSFRALFIFYLLLKIVVDSQKSGLA